MKKNLAALFILVIAGCSKNNSENDQANVPEKQLLSFKSEKAYCRDHDELISESIFTYDKGVLIQEKTTQTNVPGFLTEKVYEYDSDNKLKKLTIQEGNNAASVWEYQYKNGMIEKEIRPDKSYVTYIYKDKKLVQKKFFAADKTEYNRETFNYKNGMIFQKRSELGPFGSGVTTTTYERNKDGFITKVSETTGGVTYRLIEENIYDGNKLVEKKKYTYDPDACFSPCCGNYNYRYEY